MSSSGADVDGSGVFHSAPVYLGFAEHVPEDKRFRLRSHYLPLGKIGGKPSWLSYQSLPAADQLICSNCAKPMCFLLQVYATQTSDPPHAFHRSLFVFVCRQPECSKPNSADNLRVFRCQLPLINEFYRSDRPFDADLDGDVEPDVPVDRFVHLCEVCGCDATKKCARCEQRWYCAKEHQAMHWRWAHKNECGGDGNAKNIARIDYDNTLVFPEMGIGIDQEMLTVEDLDDSDDEAAVDDDDERAERERMAEYRRFMADHHEQQQIANGGGGGGEMEDSDDADETPKDIRFARFSRMISENPDQVLRYQRGGDPLWATDAAPVPASIADCELCGGRRQFEMQLTPRLLALMGVDAVGQSIDWATVAIFTCASSCPIPNHGYAAELVVKQDFQ